MIIPVILSGGSGTRLWPLSRTDHPKQLLALCGDLTLLQQTVLRARTLTDAKPIVIGNKQHRFTIENQLQQIDSMPADILLEPLGRDTAPAIAIATFTALQRDPGAILLVLPADHMMTNTQTLVDAVTEATPAANSGKLVTFGIEPTQPTTAYGYIQLGEKDHDQVYQVANFVEKPNAERAQQYLDSGDYYWNSGMFLFKAQSYLDALKQFEPEMFDCCQRSAGKLSADLNFKLIDEATFSACPSQSIDYAVMEKTDQAMVRPLSHSGWSDVGSWNALWEQGPFDEQHNVIKGDVIAENVNHCYLESHDRLLAVLGVRDHIIVETSDAVLVAHKDHCQDVKKLTQQIKQLGRNESEHHQTVYRPWGSYQSLVIEPGFQVKKITVNPGGQLSLQLHHHRSEHWVVVSGVARVTRGEEEFDLVENQSVYIPAETKHRLCNKTEQPVVLIEVQTGSYLGEDDIVRFEDIYGRVEEITNEVPTNNS